MLRNFSDISKARELLAWEPKWSVEEGLEATVEWFIGQRAEEQMTDDGGQRTDDG